MSLKTLQLNFLFWASRWVREGTEHEKPITYCDLPDIVCLLEALGYRLTKIDTDTNSADLSSPKTPTMKVCNNSGQKYIIESESAACHCLKPKRDSIKENFCEITTNTSQSTSSVIETGTDLVPKIPKELSVLIGNVISYFVKLIRKKHSTELLYNEKLQNGTPSPSPKENARELSDYVKSIIELNSKPGLLYTVEQYTTPNRCKSLDTLLTEERSSPKITENEAINKSNPNIKLKLKVPPSPAADSVKELNNIFEDIYVSLANAKKLVQTLGQTSSTLSIPKKNFEKTSPLAKSLEEEMTMKPSTSRTKKMISNRSVIKKSVALPGKRIPVLEKKDSLKCRKSNGISIVVKNSPKPPSGRKSLNSKVTFNKKIS